MTPPFQRNSSAHTVSYGGVLLAYLAAIASFGAVIALIIWGLQ